MHTAGHGEGALRRHRVSISSASYFITLCTAERRGNLTSPAVAAVIWSELSAIESDGHWGLRAGVMMPDHLHLFIQLGAGLTLSRTIARLKAKTKLPLASIGAKWQSNFYEHRLRADDLVVDVMHYMYLNPYRAGLLSIGETYPHFRLGAQEAGWFMLTTDTGVPFPEWLQ